MVIKSVKTLNFFVIFKAFSMRGSAIMLVIASCKKVVISVTIYSSANRYFK